MKSTGLLSLFALFLLSLAAPQVITAQPSASGNLRFTMDDEAVRTLEFAVSTDAKGNTSGAMTLVDQAGALDSDEEEPGREEKPFELSVKADFSELTVEKNRAVMNGVIVDSTHRTYIGKWVQLVIEDNGDNPERADQLVWRFCQRQPGGWIPSDAELDKDDGAYLSWWATDAERKDDVGIPSPNLIPGEETSCPVLPLRAHFFATLSKWEGNLVVVP
jgi:hypothetical protein